MKARVYIETSVVGHLTSWPSKDVTVLGHQTATQKWWSIAFDRYDVFVSELVVGECEAGDPQAARERLDAIEGLTLLPLNDAVLELTEALVDSHAVPSTEPEDAAHIAVAAAHSMNYLVTWNFRHIANAATLSKIQEACRQHGFEPPQICSPDQLMEPEKS